MVRLPLDQRRGEPRVVARVVVHQEASGRSERALDDARLGPQAGPLRPPRPHLYIRLVPPFSRVLAIRDE